MEDKKRKKDDKRKREASQKVAEEKNKESTKPSSAQSPATFSCVSPRPGTTPLLSPCPSAGVSTALPPGGNNAKRATVANGQPSSGTPPSQRYMPREVPPRFRSQQDHKVLLKRGQPPLSCMLLGGGTGGEATPPILQGDNPNATTTGAPDPTLSPSAPHSSSSSSIAASATSSYANSTWGEGSGSQPPSQGLDKVIVDGSDLEEWPSILEGGGLSVEAQELAGAQNSSASWSDRHIQQEMAGLGTVAGKSGDMDIPSQSYPSSLPNKCAESSVVWGSSTQAEIGGTIGATAQSSNSKVSPLGNQEGSLGISSGVPGANFNPNFNPSAWPALMQDGREGVGAAATDGGLSSQTTIPSLSANATLDSPPTPVSTASQQLQVHEMHIKDEHNSGDWDGVGPELGAGPKKIGDVDMDYRVAGGGLLPPSASNANMGASRTDLWDRGADVGLPVEGGKVWGCGSPEKGGLLGDKAWGAANGGRCNTLGVSQGAWEGASLSQLAATVGSCDSTVGSISGDGSSNGSSCGGTGGIPQDSKSPTFSILTRALDNQKEGADADGAAVELAGQVGSGGEEDGSGAGALPQNRPREQAQHPSGHQPPNPEVALQSMLSRIDLDPRVLCNTGWGKTQVRQNVAWDLEGGSASASSSSSMSANSPATAYSATTGSVTTNPPASGRGFGSAPSRDGWNEGGVSLPSRGPPLHSSNTQRPEGLEGNQGKVTGESQGWGNDRQEQREHRGEGRDGERGEWGNFGEQGTPAGGKGGGWGDGQEDKGMGGWKEMRRDGGGWGPRGGADWGQREPAAVSGGRREDKGSSRGSAGGKPDEGSWSSWDEGRPRRGGGGDMGGKQHQGWGGKPQPSQIPNNQGLPMKAQNQPQQQSQAPQQQSQAQQQLRTDTRALQEVRGRPGGPPAQNQSPGWSSGPISETPSVPESSGWEEPSPQSISRKMEIDDGTSAWGDPTRFNSKSVNLWDKNSSQAQTHQQKGQPQQPPGRQPGPPANRDANPGKAPGMTPVMWGGGGPPSDQSSDNGTTSWGKSSEAPTGWGDPDESSKGSGWGNPSTNPIKSGSKSMQEGWAEVESSVSSSHRTSQEEEEEGGAMWNNTASQGGSSSYNSGGWGQGHGGKRSNKCVLKGGGGDSWMNSATRQFSNMGILDEDSSAAQDKNDRRGMNDYNGEMRRGGKGGGVFRSPSSKEVGSGETGSYYDKMGGHGAFGGSSGISQLRGIHQPGVHPLNAPQGIRAQVPHQFLSPQVPGSMLKQMPPPSSNMVGGLGSLGGGVFPPHLSPQHLAMLSGIYPHMQQFQLACQLILQQQQQQLLQNQRKFSQPMRQQPDTQQLARIMAILQQQRQQQQGVGGSGSGGSKQSPSHLGSGTPKHAMADPLLHPGMGSSLADLHGKTQGGYTGFGSGGNMSGPELGSMVGAAVGMKDGGVQQSRFKWMMEGHSSATSPPDPALHKNGPMSTPVKLRGGSPYSQYELLGGDGLGAPPQGLSDNWHRTPGSKLGTSSWPPEFQPGVPWKGIQSADPDSDPYMTPGSVLGSPGPPNLGDTEHQLLRDNAGSNPSLNTLLPSPGAWPYSASESPLTNAHSSAKYSEYKSSWPPEPIGHNKSWKTNRNSSQPPRPPPGLTHQKQATSSPWPGGGPRLARGWGGSGNSQDSRFGPDSAWSDGGASRGGSCWLLLSNLTPQIDGSTLRTICMQHGPLLTFHLGLTQGSALIRYSSRQEAAKAQGALHMCVLGNTTILAEYVSEEEVARYFAHSQAGVGGSGCGGGVGSSQGSSGTGTTGGGGTPRESDRERERAGGGAMTSGTSDRGEGVVVGSVGPSSTGWQSLDVTGSSPDTPSAQGPGLGIFAQWSTNGAGEVEGGGGLGGGAGGVEPGRAGLWGGVTTGYPSSSSLWGAPQMEDRHQIGSPAALLPGDLLGGGSDSI